MDIEAALRMANKQQAMLKDVGDKARRRAPLQAKRVAVSITLAAAMALSGCATTKPGQEIDTANKRDAGLTLVGLAVGLEEANPVGVGLVPIKYGMGRAVETTLADDCITLDFAAGSLSTLFNGAAASNGVLILGGGTPLGLAVGGAVGYWYWSKRPVSDCLPGVPQLDALAAAYAAGDIDQFMALFAPDATTTDYAGADAIRVGYGALFATSHNRVIKWREPGRIWVNADGRGGNYLLDVGYDDAGLINKFEWEPEQ